MLKLAAIVSGVVLLIALAVLMGFLVPVRPFPPPEDAPVTWQPIPADLPEPVGRFARAMSPDGERLPVVGSISYSGTGSARPFGVWLPIRHTATIVPGRSMDRVMEFPWFSATLIRAEDTYRDGAGRTTVSGLVQGVTEGPSTDQGAYLALAAESILVPSWQALAGAWEGVDVRRARLAFPYEGGTEHLLVTFDAETAFPTRIQADRFKSEEGPKTGWTIELGPYRSTAQGLHAPSSFEVAGDDETGPWSRWTVDRMVVASAAP